MSMSTHMSWHKSVVILSVGLFETPIFCFGLFRNGSKKSKQTENFFWFREKGRNRTETDLVLACFGSNTNKNSCSCPFPCPCPSPRPCPLHKSVLVFSFGLFRNADFSFRFVSKRSRNTETNRTFFLVSRKTPQQNQNRSSFGLFRFEPEQTVVYFEDVLC
jgi:hypothetical protein